MELIQKYINEIALLFFVIALFNGAIYYTWLWQLKEYRLDRMMDMLRLKSGIKRIMPFFLTLRMTLLAFALVAFAFSENNLATMLFLLSLSVDVFDIIIRGVKHKLYRPDRTAKAILIVFLTIFVGLLLASFFHLNIMAKAIIAVFISDINSVIVLSFQPITRILKNRLILKATKKVSDHENLTVIGITGSFGKSSCKEFLSAILEQKFSVLKTPGNINVDIGVAQLILKKLKPEHRIMICEMGAYRKGEIKKICDIVHPQFGIVTAVKNCHLALFGSEENLKDAKFELIQSLTENGTVICNLDTNGSADLFERSSHQILKKRISYSLESQADFKPENIDIRKDSLSFVLNSQKFEAKLFGKQNIYNLLPAIAVAIELGMSLHEIAEAIKKIEQPKRTMTLIKKENISIVDDSYNSNPDGVIAALDYLSLFKSEYKIMVFPGMLELGENSDMEHLRVAKKIAEVCDLAVFTSDDFEKPIRKGIKLAGSDKFDFAFISDNQQKVFDFVNKKIKNTHAAILFESRGAADVMNKLLNK